MPIEERKALLAKLLRRQIDGIAFNEHYTDGGAIIYRHACKLGCEGDRIKALRLSVPVRSRCQLAEDQEPAGSGGNARSRGGLELTPPSVLKAALPARD